MLINYLSWGANLLFCPSLGLVEHGEVTANFQVVAVEPDGTLIGLAVLGIIDLSAFPLVLFLGETSQYVNVARFFVEIHFLQTNMFIYR